MSVIQEMFTSYDDSGAPVCNSCLFKCDTVEELHLHEQNIHATNVYSTAAAIKNNNSIIG